MFVLMKNLLNFDHYYHDVPSQLLYEIFDDGLLMVENHHGFHLLINKFHSLFHYFDPNDENFRVLMNVYVQIYSRNQHGDVKVGTVTGGFFVGLTSCKVSAANSPVLFFGKPIVVVFVVAVIL